MRVAITSTGDSLDSLLDERFGRCSYFVVYDTESKSTEFIPNPNKSAENGAGPASVQLVAARKVSKIVSGEFGMKIKSLVDCLQLQLIVVKEPKTVREIIAMLNH